MDFKSVVKTCILLVIWLSDTSNTRFDLISVLVQWVLIIQFLQQHKKHLENANTSFISRQRTLMSFSVLHLFVLPDTQTKCNENKKHSENADTSTSLTFDLEVWPWPHFKVKKAYVIRSRFLYCALVPGMISVNVIICEIWPLIHFFRPLTFTCDLQLMSRSLSL